MSYMQLGTFPVPRLALTADQPQTEQEGEQGWTRHAPASKAFSFLMFCGVFPSYLMSFRLFSLLEGFQHPSRELSLPIYPIVAPAEGDSPLTLTLPGEIFLPAFPGQPEVPAAAS